MATMLKKTTTTNVYGRSNDVIRYFDFTHKIVRGEERLYIHDDLYVPVAMLNRQLDETADSLYSNKTVSHKWELHTPVSKNLDLGSPK